VTECESRCLSWQDTPTVVFVNNDGKLLNLYNFVILVVPFIWGWTRRSLGISKDQQVLFICEILSHSFHQLCGCVLPLLVEFFGSLSCAKPIIEDENGLHKCYNSSFKTPINGSRVNDICRRVAIDTDHFSDRLEQSVACVCVCVMGRYRCNEIVFDLDIWRGVQTGRCTSYDCLLVAARKMSAKSDFPRHGSSCLNAP